MLGVHFTNHETSWGGSSPVRSTGFVEGILRDGFRPYSNFGVGGDPVKLFDLFVHHGLRCNKKRVKGIQSRAAAIIVDLTGLQMQQGYDAPEHRQVNEVIDPSRIVAVIYFDWQPDRDQFVKEWGRCEN